MLADMIAPHKAPVAATVVIVAYESGDFLQPCVDALAAQTFEDFEAVIVDNASSDGSVRDLRRRQQPGRGRLDRGIPGVAQSRRGPR
jgi:GT2 family glycosyltransferase